MPDFMRVGAMIRDMLINNIENDLRKHIDEDYKKGIKRFFKDKDLKESDFFSYGVKTASVRKVGKKYYPYIKNLEKDDFFRLCEKMLNKRNSELRTIVFQWVYRMKGKIIKNDYDIFYGWLQKYVTGWSSCDDFCTHAFGYLIYNYSKLITEIKNYWVKSNNRWVRRAAAVVMIYSIRRDKYIPHALKIADKLIKDDKNLVQKGTGWLLKEIANKDRDIVDNYLVKNYDEIPRVILRYAIEKFPEGRRKEILNLKKI
ncbi:MAG: DNA alkylation repair protein [Candidatus Mcinerneyibacterium aminivorans]|uniref:DNA alkylation repair protein n=1 Tax=Candidatus Mcinerneyibacterium aminivorans TaxID=2703815 RepID=A0A5D0MBM1_9BACT|nr:MAG: DNA alkylation repair protein [Candidatus Mcinerneyibacterium aminivorans]